MREIIDTPHNQKCRELMKKNYYEKNGKLKSSLKFYKRKYANDDKAISILTNTVMNDFDKLKELRMYNITKKFQDTYLSN